MANHSHMVVSVGALKMWLLYWTEANALPVLLQVASKQASVLVQLEQQL